MEYESTINYPQLWTLKISENLLLFTNSFDDKTWANLFGYKIGPELAQSSMKSLFIPLSECCWTVMFDEKVMLQPWKESSTFYGMCIIHFYNPKHQNSRASDKMKHCHLLSGGTEGVRNQRNTTLKEKTSCQVKPRSVYLPAFSHCPKSPRMSASVHLQEVLSNPDPRATSGLWAALHLAYPTRLISSPDQSLGVSTLSPLSFCLEPGFLPNKKIICVAPKSFLVIPTSQTNSLTKSPLPSEGQLTKHWVRSISSRICFAWKLCNRTEWAI